MNYISTRDPTIRCTISEAIKQGLAPDGGLFIPEHFPRYDLNEFKDKTIEEIGYLLLKPFFEGDPLYDHLEEICKQALNFPIPTEKLNNKYVLLELFHGPTGSFKDVGARFLSQCFEQMEGTRTILVATSGDTGSAVAAAFSQSEKSKVVILFPKGKVSELQDLLLTCWGENVLSIKVRSDFDKCQRLVKMAFNDSTISKRFRLTSANSINIGRLLPQCIYYAATSLWYREKFGKPANFIIPTGNMGNSLACIWVKHMGFPIDRICLAANSNKTIPEYFTTGKFEPRPSIQTLANAMDVGNPSNMERYLSLVKQHPSIEQSIVSLSVGDEEIADTIKYVFNTTQYLICPHTATAFYSAETLGFDHGIIVATAAPVKFKDVIEPLFSDGINIVFPDTLAELKKLPISYIEIDPNFAEFVSSVERFLSPNI